MWEYRSLAAAPDKLDEELNKLGQQGWELISVRTELWRKFGGEAFSVRLYRAVLKRQRPTQPGASAVSREEP